MNKLRFIVVMLAALFISTAAYSQQKLKLAVLDPVVAGEKLTDGLRISVREIVSSTFVNYADNYSIVERSLLDKVMAEAKFSNSDAVDESQATQLGKLAGADRVVLSVISRFESRCMVSIKLINVETATIDRQISKMVDYNSVLDVTEPLTLAVLGKGDANFSVSPSQPVTSATTTPAPTVSAQPAQQQQTAAAANTDAFIKWSGVMFEPTGLSFEYVPDEMSPDNMGRISQQFNFNVLIDLSTTTVRGQHINDFAKTNFTEKTYAEFPKEMERLLDALNEYDKYKFSYNYDSPITLVVKVRDVDQYGRVNTSDFAFVDTKTGQYLTGTRIKSEGGRNGSFPNLMADAYVDEACPSFIKQFKKAIKKSRK